MQKLELRGVHVFGKVPNQPGVFKLLKVNPYVRLGYQNEALFIQAGQVFTEEGGPIAEGKFPGWFAAELAKVSKAALRECGWPRKE